MQGPGHHPADDAGVAAAALVVRLLRFVRLRLDRVALLVELLGVLVLVLVRVLVVLAHGSLLNTLNAARPGRFTGVLTGYGPTRAAYARSISEAGG